MISPHSWYNNLFILDIQCFILANFTICTSNKVMLNWTKTLIHCFIHKFEFTRNGVYSYVLEIYYNISHRYYSCFACCHFFFVKIIKMIHLHWYLIWSYISTSCYKFINWLRFYIQKTYKHKRSPVLGSTKSKLSQYSLLVVSN